MLQIVLIRPGSTDYDQQHRIQGTLDVPLSEQGNSEVVRLIGELADIHIEAIYVSAGEPAQQTGKALANGLGVKMKKLDRMRNLDYGLWQGMLVDDVRQKQPKAYRQWQEQPENVCPPEGEMLSEARRRVRAAMTKLLKRHKEGIVGLVVPEPLASFVRQFVQHDELGDLWKITNGHGRFETLDVQPEVVLAHGS